MVRGFGFVGFVDVDALLVVDGFVGFAGGRWLVIAGFVGFVLREIEREAILQRGKNKEPKIIIIITVLQTVWKKGSKWSLFKCCGFYWYKSKPQGRFVEFTFFFFLTNHLVHRHFLSLVY